MAIPHLRKTFPGISVIASAPAAAMLNTEKVVALFRHIDTLFTGTLSEGEQPAADREPLPSEGEEFVRTLVRGVLNNQAELDQLISKFAPEYPVDQLAIVDRNVLRLGAYELLHTTANRRAAAGQAALFPRRPGGSGSLRPGGRRARHRARPFVLWGRCKPGAGPPIERIRGRVSIARP